MDSADLTDHVRFSPEAPHRSAVFETERLFAQVMCLERNQSFGPASDPRADAVITIVAGEAVFLVGRRRKRLRQWGAVLVPAGAELVITNASADPLVVLMLTAPPPVGAEAAG
ncbi:MAG: hypothetical protein M3245_02225 [Actinomycetota bacterium]|nr:hypothetical protein [Actinomycetota bacterium]